MEGCHEFAGIRMNIDERQLKDWMLAGLDGGAAAHSHLLQALVPILRAFYRRRFNGSEDDIEDLVQDTLIAVHERRATFERTRPFTAWLFAIARYKMIDEIRRTSRIRALDELGEMPTTGEEEDTQLAAIDIENLLGTLPPKQARSIRETKLKGLSVAEAAASAGISESDVKISVHRGLKALAAHARRRGDEN